MTDHQTDPLNGRATLAGSRRALFAASFLTAESELDFATSFLDRTDLAAAFHTPAPVPRAKDARGPASFLDRGA